MDPLTTTIIVKPTVKLATRLLRPLVEKLGKEVSAQAQLAYHNIFNSYTKYLEDSYEKHLYFNSIVFKNEQKKLADYYLPLTLIKQPANEQTSITSYPQELIEETKKVLIVDTAGMGKTTLLKYLFLCCVEKEAGIPIYIELRKLTKKKSLLDFIVEQLSDVSGKCKPDLLFKLLETGGFVFFLDGYDEIPESERTEVTAGLQEFIAKAPKNKYLMTSREEGGLVAFPQFQRYIIRPLLKEEAYALLKKYADPKLSELLIAKLEQPENAAIHEFLTNPLLTSLLYKSFEHKHVVPLKRHIFYRQVFEALYEAHDLTKEGGEYHRSKKSGLDVDRFEHILRCLGALSYRKAKIEFTKEELLEFINEAKKLASENKVPPSNILHDLTHAVPLMVEDGNYIRWSHRSIQEYFAAQYICKDTKGNQTKILFSYLRRPDFTSHLNLITLCADIDRASFRQSIAKWIAETLLSEYISLYRTGFEKIPDALLTERKELIVGKYVFFVRVRLPENFSMKDQNSHLMLKTVMGPIEEQIKILLNSQQTHGNSMGLTNPAVAIHTTEIGVFIENLHQRTDLPFIETVVPEMVSVVDSIDQNINVLPIDDAPLNPVNDPNNFLLVNALVRIHASWKFNAKTAGEFLQAIDDESKAQDEFIEW